MASSRRVIKTSAAVVGILATLACVDSGFAVHAERNLAQRIKADSNMEMTPYVKIGGMAYLSSFATGRWSSINVRARDIDAPGFGLVSVEFGAVNVSVPPKSVLTGDFEASPAKTYFTKLQLDGLSLGHKMGFTDLAIQNLDDVSPAGGWETEALFEATPHGWATPAKVAVKLRIKEGTVSITPIEVISGPYAPDGKKTLPGAELNDEVKAEISKSFELTLSEGSLPLGLQPTRVYVSGGSVTIEGEQIRCNVVPENFMPPVSEDEEHRSAGKTQPIDQSDPMNCRVRKFGA